MKTAKVLLSFFGNLFGNFSGVLAMAVVFLGFAQPSFAAFSIEELHQASRAAVDDFQKENPDHVEHFTGYKSWKSGDDAKVKVYVSHDGMNMEFNYNCYKHDNHETHETIVQCHAQ